MDKIGSYVAVSSGSSKDSSCCIMDYLELFYAPTEISRNNNNPTIQPRCKKGMKYFCMCIVHMMK